MSVIPSPLSPHLQFARVLLLLSFLPLFLKAQCASILECYLGTDGWTTIPEDPETLKIYVSAAGNDDTNDGFSELSPLRTPSAGYELLRDGFPDWLHFRRGDTFSEPIAGNFRKGGPSPSRPMVVKSYGDPADSRPTFVSSGSSPLTSAGADTFQHVAFFELAFSGVGIDSSSPLRFLGPMTDILFEDFLIDETRGLIFQVWQNEPIQTVAFRRSVVRNTYSRTNAHCQGIYAHGVSDFLLEENLLYHCGWTQNPAYWAQWGYGNSTMFNHNTYLHWHDGLTIRNNLYLRGASANMKFRCDSNTHPALNLVVEDNFLFGSEGHISLGGNEDDIPRRFVGTIIRNNVFSRSGEGIPEMNGNTYTDRTLGWGVAVFGNKNAALCGNLFIEDLRRNGYCFHLHHGLENILVRDNVMTGSTNRMLLNFRRPSYTDKWRAPFRVENNIIQDPSPREESGTVMHLVQFEDYVSEGFFSFNGNIMFSGQADQMDWIEAPFIETQQDLTDWFEKTNTTIRQVNFPDSSRNFLSYITDVLSLSSVEEFVETVTSTQTRIGSTWRDDLTASAINAYLREGFGMPTNGVECEIEIDLWPETAALVVGAAIGGVAGIALFVAVSVVLVLFVVYECRKEKSRKGD